MSPSLPSHLNAFFSRLQAISAWQRTVAVALAAVIYLIAFLALNQRVGWSLEAFSFIPVAAGALFFGVRGAWITSLPIIAINLFLAYITTGIEGPLNNHILRSLPGSIALLTGGSIVGLLSTQFRRLDEDLRKRLQVEQALRSSEERFRKIFDEGPLGMVVINPELKVERANATFYRMLKYQEDELYGWSLVEFSHPNDKQESLLLIQQLLAGEIPFINIESRYIRRDGTTIWINLTASLVRDEKGQLLYLLVMLDDITERKQIEKAEIEHRLMIESLRETSAMLNSSLDLNRVLEQILAYIERLAPHDGACVLLLEKGRVEPMLSTGCLHPLHGEETLLSSFPIEDVPILQSIAESGQLIVIDDTEQHAVWRQAGALGEFRSFVGIPLRTQGKTTGFLIIESKLPQAFPARTHPWMLAFAEQAAAAIQNARLFEAVQQYGWNMARLNDLTQAATGALDLKTLLPDLARRLGKLLHADSAYITLWNEASQTTIPVAAYGEASNIFHDYIPAIKEKTLTQSTLSSGHALVIDDTFISPWVGPQLARMFPERSLLALPLIAGERKLGAVLIGFKELHSFTDEEVALGEQAAGQVALAITRTQAYEAEQQRTAELVHTNSLLMALSQVAMRIGTASSVDSVLETLGFELKEFGVNCMVALQISGASALLIRYLSADQRIISHYEKVSGVDLFNYLIPEERFPLYRQVVSQKRGIFLHDLSKDMIPALHELPPIQQRRLTRLVQMNAGYHSIFLPLITEDQPFGFLWMWGKDLAARDLPVATIFAGQVAAALENARLYTEVQQLAMTDHLTGLYNRRALNELGIREVERAIRFKRPLALVMFDIDDFKQFNDHYGHSAGDEVLRLVTALSRSLVRDVDIVARFGGDEIVILLPENTCESAELVVERIKRALAENPYKNGDFIIPVTISAGTGELSSEVQDLPSLLAIADQALYAAKGTRHGQKSAR